jgi:predicted dehydrogenase
VTTSWAVAGAEGTFCEVHTTQRAIRVEGRGRRIRQYSRSTRRWLDEGIGPTDAAGIASGHAGFWAATLQAMQSHTAMPVPARQALRQVAILDAAHRSSRSRGALMEVPLAV